MVWLHGEEERVRPARRGVLVGHGQGKAVLSTILVSCSSSVQLTESVLDGK